MKTTLFFAVLLTVTHLSFSQENFDLIEEELEQINISAPNTVFETTIDSKLDAGNNAYKLSSMQSNNKTVTVLKKYSNSNVLIWEFSIESFDNIEFRPKAITYIDDSEVSISCDKHLLGTESIEPVIFKISKSGEFLSELTLN